MRTLRIALLLLDRFLQWADARLAANWRWYAQLPDETPLDRWNRGAILAHVMTLPGWVALLTWLALRMLAS